MKNKNSEKNIFKGIIAGAIGGLVASFVMTKYQELTQNFSTDTSDPKEKGEPANVKAAALISENLFDRKLSKSEKDTAGEVMHYVMGGISGAIYGVTAEYSDVAKKGAGFPFGSAVWAIADDVVVPALGLSKMPTEYRLSTHAYALSSHWVYGLTSELVRKTVRKAL